MRLAFLHGWGFDASVWVPLRAELGEYAHEVEQRGYFGDPAPLAADGPIVAITHSHGTMRLLAAPPRGLLGLVAINGFARFAAPPRVIERMIARFATAPQAVLGDFRARCGAEPAPDIAHPDVLGADLIALRDDDETAVCAGLGAPILSLQGARDPIFSRGNHATAFGDAAGIVRSTNGAAGHLLPLEDPVWCAERIRAFVGTLA